MGTGRATERCGCCDASIPHGVHVRTCAYLNNVVEQDHRAIKARCGTMRGFKSFTTAATTLAGIELAHRMRKRQFICQSKDRRVPLDLRRDWYGAIMV